MSKRQAVHPFEDHGPWVRRLAWMVAPVLMLLAAQSIGAEEAHITDSAITAAVERSLLVDNLVNHHGIDVVTRTGIVTLDGAVHTLYGKKRASEHAQSIKGVRSVVDNLTVQPVSRSDDEIRRDVSEALQADPATESMEVSVSSEEGQVTLAGKAQSWAERELASEVVQAVKGVRGVDNALQLEFSAQREDDEIENEIRQRLKSDVWLAGRIFDITVADGVVVLRGTVGSALEKTRATTQAHVRGVTTVDGRDIQVEWWAKNHMRQENYADPTDKEIARAVADALRHDPRVWSFHPTVEVFAGVVTLRGVVSNLGAKQAAEEDARHTIGVRRVNNFLKVRPQQSVEDPQIAQRVQARISNHPLLDQYQVGATAYRGTVYLAGEVDSQEEKVIAGDVASRVQGVVEVKNRLRVLDKWEWKSDPDIKRDINDELWWSPFVDQDQVQVEVRDGVATLTGLVDSWWERTMATDNALEGGARVVRNQLTVR